jgi:hypothetical protein
VCNFDIGDKRLIQNVAGELYKDDNLMGYSAV